MFNYRYFFLWVFLLPLTPTWGQATSVVPIQIGEVVRPVERRVIGLNLNYLLDNQRVRMEGQGLEAALKQLSIGSMRYPGGGKSQSYLWSTPPFENSRPTLAVTGPGKWPSVDRNLIEPDGKTYINRPLSFDEFMEICGKTGATPTLVVDYSPGYLPYEPGTQAPTKQQLLDTAVAWVKYANIIKGYHVKYWEIGNETDRDNYNGGATAENYARDLTEFAQAMKKVDPSILIGANTPASDKRIGDYDVKAGNTVPWLKVLLKNAAGSIDFLVIHIYPCYGWKSFDDYTTQAAHLNDDLNNVHKALKSLASAEDADRIRIAVTEFNAINYLGFPKECVGWQNENNLGHALVVFDMVGDWLLDPKVDLAELWNSRWLNNKVKDHHEINDTLDASNNLLPTGVALSIWSRYVLELTNKVTASRPEVRCFASSSRDGSKWSLFLINTTKAPIRVNIPTSQTHFNQHTPCMVFSGSGPDDTHPEFKESDHTINKQDQTSVMATLKPVSVTVLFSP